MTVYRKDGLPSKSGKYIRTKEIKEKQSKSISQTYKNGNYNFEEIGNKIRKTLAQRNKRSGRKKIKTLIEKICYQCNNTFLTEKSEKKYCCIKCYRLSQIGRKMSEEQKLKLKGIKRPSGPRPYRRKQETPEFTRFKNTVHKLSGNVYEQNKHIINPNNFLRTRCGVEGGYQLDHIIPIREGFDKGMTPEELSVLENLRMLPWRENLARNKK